MAANYGADLPLLKRGKVGPNNESPSERNPRLLLFVLMGFCLLFIISYTSRLIEYSQTQTLLANWETRIEEANQRQSKLVAQREFVYSDDYVDKIAREDLGLAKPGDTVIVIIPDTENSIAQPLPVETPQILSTAEPVQMPNWQQWVELFKQKSTTRPLY